MSYKHIKRELDKAIDNKKELKEDVEAVIYGIEARKSGQSIQTMVFDVFSNAMWIVREPMCYYLYLKCAFASDEDLTRIENELLPQYPVDE